MAGLELGLGNHLPGSGGDETNLAGMAGSWAGRARTTKALTETTSLYIYHPNQVARLVPIIDSIY
jgi:hypothetical protein